ncbi:MAG: ABC transporter permease subunit [Planctomycetes bacterium]|nr:ABC transporter permease subunit [Planctomycetota bacterium]
MRRNAVLAVARLEFAEVVRSRWILFCAIVHLVLATTFVTVGMHESTVIGFTGMGRALLSFAHVLVFLLPLLALTATGQVVNSAKDDGALELLFGNPLQRGEWIVAVTGVRLAILVVPLLVAMPVLAILGTVWFGEPMPWTWLWRCLGVSTALLACYVSVGMLISTVVRSTSRALIAMLLVWSASVALIDFGLIGAMLQLRLEPRFVFLLASLNPVQCARLALLSAAEPELSTLGPVGFWVSNAIGPGGLLAVGVAWPLLLAATLWSLAAARLRRGDLV